jgi:GAF domain-containing protein/HAMP domain-containing protein
MKTTQTTFNQDSKQEKIKGSLAGIIVRTLLIFAFLPLTLMAGVAYFRTRALFQEQSISQSQKLLDAQIKTIDHGIANKESHLEHLLESSDFTILIELALHANPKNSEFRDIRDNLIQEFKNSSIQDKENSFDQFFLLDTSGNIKIASNANWQGITLDSLTSAKVNGKNHSVALYGLSPLYENEFILLTMQEYKTKRGSVIGSIVGITEKESLQELVQPLNGLSSLASAYFVLPDQRLIYSEPETGVFTLVQSTSQNSINSIFSELMKQENTQPKTLKIKTPTGESALAQLKWFPRMQTGVMLAVKASNAYGQVSSLTPFTILLILGMLLATGLVMVISNNRVIKPLRSLSAITRSFAEGDWNRRAEVISSDEVGVLASSFNQMADKIGKDYHSLEQKVNEGERQIRTTAEVAQNITAVSNLNETLNRTVELLVQQFGFHQASIYLLDRSGNYIEFKTGFGSASKGLAEKKYRLAVNSESIIGWVCVNNQARISADVLEIPLHLRNDLLPETRSEANIPISSGNLVLGVLNVQSTETDAFSTETVIMLQTMSSQIATAIQTAELSETSRVSFEELAHLYRSSRLIAKANTEQEILKISSQILIQAPHPVIIFQVQSNNLIVYSSSDTTKENAAINTDFSKFSKANIDDIENYLQNGEIISALNNDDIPGVFKEIMQRLELENAAYLPVRKNKRLTAILMIGGRKQSLSNATVQPYADLAALMSITMEKADAMQQTKKHLHDAEALVSITESISTSSDQQIFFATLHEKITQILGDYSMTVALYNEKNNMISIPFNYKDKKISETETFALGDDLTSIILRTGLPLILVEDTAHRAAELGAKIIGKAPRSWMGVPMLIQNKPIGALIIQDADHDHAFNEDNLKVLNAISGQVAGVINNTHLLEESRNTTIQLETAAEIARDISSSLNLDELLVKAVNFIRERFDFYHASVFLHDLEGEFTIIRESTGDVGAQMKRTGYKIGIGSRSIVGFVSSRGEQLVVDNTAKDTTYFANPLFPDTRSEAAFPLKVGERILGEIDVQSIHPYAFTEDKLRSLQILADQMAIAVVNTELFSETQEHLSQHRLLHHITTTAASGTTIEEALENAVNGLQVTLGGDRVTILLTNRDKNSLEPKASTGYAEDISKMVIPFGSGITGWSAAHKRPLRIKNVTEDPRYIQVSPNTRSELAIPLVFRNELLGVLNVESELVDAYTENDEEMLGTLGGSLAAIIANARLVEQIRVQAERDRLIYEVTSRIRRSTDIQSIMIATTNELTRLTGAHYAKIQIKPGSDTEQEGA